MQDTRQPRWIMGLRDLPKEVTPATYFRTQEDGSVKSTTFSKRKRQVIDGLNMAPMFCASPVRIGDVVFRLKSEDGINIQTLTTPLPEARKYYALGEKVELVEREHEHA